MVAIMTEMETETTAAEKKTVVLLDVDGVVNWWAPYRVLREIPRDARPKYREHEADGYLLRIPYHMPELVRELVGGHEVWWCTAWRHLANRHVAPILGIEELPVVTDAAQARGADWKADAVTQMLFDEFEGRNVWWIEDFGASWISAGAPQMVAELGVKLIDTSERGYLRREDVFSAGLL